MPTVNVIGAGLAGSEAAWQIAQAGVDVNLYEMRPVKMTPAHHTSNFAELVCTNSLRANQITNAVGLLKEEMRQLHSIIIQSADATAVPAGGALAVDREPFSELVTQKLTSNPHIHVANEELSAFPDGITVVATGPLTAPGLAQAIVDLNGEAGLSFFDAAAPILDANTINEDIVYKKSRYDRGEAAYLNCPMTKDELFGPLKPVGLEDPRTGKEPYAVVQLRQDNAAASLYNMVGFQTHLKWGEQKRVFRLIPGLENVQIIRYGVMHRNTFMKSPVVLEPTYASKRRPDLFFAGQMTGVEGYVESAASGLIAGINAARIALGETPLIFPETTAMGSMAHYITHTSAHHFQPMNANFGIMPALTVRVRNKKERNQQLADRALKDLATFQARMNRVEQV